MKEEKTARIMQAKTVDEFMEFVRVHAVDLEPSDSISGRYRGVKTKDKELTMILPISIMSNDRERIGERTRRLLTSSTGRLIRALS